MRIRNREYTVDWAHLAFIAVIAAYVAWYLLDARSVSLARNNLLLLQPLALFILLFCAIVVRQCFRRADAKVEEEIEEEDPLAPTLPIGRELLRVGLLGLAFGAMVFLLNTIGFDIAIWLFALAAMLLCGERRPLALIIYPLAVAVCGIYGFKALMPYPMPTAIL